MKRGGKEREGVREGRGKGGGRKEEERGGEKRGQNSEEWRRKGG